MIDAKRIEEMKRLSAEASGSRWLVEGGKFGEYKIVSQAHYADDLQISDAVTDEVHTIIDAQFIAESRQFVPDIIAAYEEQAEEIERLRNHISQEVKLANFYREAYDIKLTHLDELHAEIAKLRKALEFYADDGNYETVGMVTSYIEIDEGTIAKEALNNAD